MSDELETQTVSFLQETQQRYEEIRASYTYHEAQCRRLMARMNEMIPAIWALEAEQKKQIRAVDDGEAMRKADTDASRQPISALTPEDGNDALLANQQDTPPQSNAQASETDAAKYQEWQSDGLGNTVERPWSLISAYRDGYEGRKHVAPHHPEYMQQWNEGARGAEIAEASMKAAQEALKPLPDWTAEELEDLDKRATEFVEEIGAPQIDTVAAVEIPEGWIPVDEFRYPEANAFEANAVIEARWADGHVEQLAFAGYTPTTSEPRWMSVRKSEQGGLHPDLPTHLRIISEPAQPSEAEAPCDSCGAPYGDLHNIETCKHLADATAEAIFDGDHTKLEAMLGRTASEAASELDSQDVAQTKSEQSEIFHPDAPTWNAGFEEDRKPKPGIIEETVSRLFGRKMEEV